MSLVASNPLYQLAVGERLDPQGAWSSPTAFDRLQTVDNDGSSYVCMVAHTSGASTEPGTGADWRTVWQLLAEKGDAGDTGATGATGPAGPAGPDATGAAAGYVWTADGDDGADWAAPSGGGGDSWTSIANPAAAVAVSDSGTNLATLALDGAELVEGARLDWRLRLRVTANPSARQISVLFAQAVNGDVTVYANLGSFAAVTSAAAGTVLSMTGSAYVVDAGAASVLAAEWLPSRHSSSADGVLNAGILNEGNFLLAGDINNVTTLRIRATANTGSDLEMQALELAYKITPPTE